MLVITLCQGFLRFRDSVLLPMHLVHLFYKKKTWPASEQCAQQQSDHPPFWIPALLRLPEICCPLLRDHKRIAHKRKQKDCSCERDILPA